jgi:hypothetical protein
MLSAEHPTAFAQNIRNSTQMMKYLRKRHLGVAVMAACWIICTGFFYGQMVSFKTTPGLSAAHPPEFWATESDKPTLIVFLHPKCTCSRASLAQVAKLQSRVPDGFHTILVLWQSPNGNSDWAKLPQPDSGQLLHYQLVLDNGGLMARRFDAHTSGQAFVYDSRGRLRFSGGLTSSRGDSENGPAFSTLLRVITNPGSSKPMPVFGCSL